MGAARSPWVPLSAVLVGTMMVALDTTIVNVALHRISVELETNDHVIEWVVTSYLLAVCVSQPATGWIADRFGRKRTFLAALALFTLASAGCGSSPSLAFLIGCRVLQGLGGGVLSPVSMAMVLEAFPREQHGRALAVWGMAMMGAPAIGPTIGGWLVTSISWHWLFFVNLPVGLGVFVAAVKLLPDAGHREPRPFDAAGLALGTSSLTLVLLAISQGSTWGWAAPSTSGCLLAGALLFGAFVRHELRTARPLLELRMFSDRVFAVAMFGYVVMVGTLYARLVYLPLELQGIRGYTALHVGLLFIAPALATAFAMSIGGRMADRTGTRRPILLGSALVMAAMLGMASIDRHTSDVAIVAIASLQGFGYGLASSPILVAGFRQLPARLVADGSTVRSLMGQVGGASTVAVVGAVVSSRMGPTPSLDHQQAAYGWGFAVCALAMLAVVLLARRLPDDRGEPIEAEPVAFAE